MCVLYYYVAASLKRGPVLKSHCFWTMSVSVFIEILVFEIVIPGNYYLQVLFLLTSGTSLKAGLTLWKQMTHRCNNVQEYSNV